MIKTHPELSFLTAILQRHVRKAEPMLKHFVIAGAYRRDGTFVFSINGHPRHNVMHQAHAEMRLFRKAPYPGELYIVRLNRRGEALDSMPCSKCACAMRNRSVKKINCFLGGAPVRISL